MKLLYSQISIITFLYLVPVMTAQAEDAPGRVAIFNPLKGGGITSIVGFFQAILDVLLIFAVPLIVFFIIYAGFMYVTARGNAEKVKQAHDALLYALIGGLIVLGANVILEIVANTVCEITGDTITNICD